MNRGGLMTASKLPWTVPIAGVLVLLPAAMTGIIAASDPGGRWIEVPSAVLLGLLGLGLLARRRWAVWAGFALIPLSVPLTVAAFRSVDATGDDDGSLGVMMAGATVILLVLLLPAVPALRRRTGPGAATDQANRTVADPPPRVAPPVRQRLLFGLLAVPAVIIGMAVFLMVLLAVGSRLFRSGAALIAIFMLVVVLLLFAAPMILLRPRHRLIAFDLTQLRVNGAGSAAFLARYDRLGRTFVAAAPFCLAVIGTWTLIQARRPAALWLTAAVLTGLVGIAVVALLSTGWRSYVALVPSGLHVPGLTRPVFVPWSAVAGSTLNHVAHLGGTEVFVAVSVSDPAAVISSPAGALVRQVNRWYGGDLQFPARLLLTEPGFLAYAIDVYRSDPDRRQAIGTLEELNRLGLEWTETAAARPNRVGR
jgi:hypothetical protein